MIDLLGHGTNLGYCTNVHPGETFSDIVESLTANALAVRASWNDGRRLGLGLWMPYFVPPPDVMGSKERFVEWDMCGIGNDRVAALRDWLRGNGLYVFTGNAFPFAGFHGRRVKHRVYEPDWSDKLRFMQSVAAVGLMADLAAPDMVRHGRSGGSVSTLPIGWSRPEGDAARVEAAGEWLRLATTFIGAASSAVGGLLTLDLEPEPGCILDTADDVIAFFDEHLPDEAHRRHIGVCHDVCHAAVMFEDQRTVLRRYAEAGIRVNKVQISSALDVDVQAIGVEAAIEHLRPFAEPRYLHQTGVQRREGDPGSFELIEDLPEAIAMLERVRDGGDASQVPDRLRVHFHVPVYLDSIGPLGSTHGQIAEAVAAAREYHDTRHFEVETYAWGVLPEELKRGTLAEGIADELKWVLRACAPGRG